MIEARVKSLAHGGAFVCEVINSSGAPQKKAFIRGVIPQELVEAEIVEEKKNLVEARALRILEPSPARTDPACPLFGQCGGCDLQHMQIAAQRSAKLNMVSDTLRKQGRLVPDGGVSLIGEQLAGFAYRKRIMLHCSTNGEIGFYRQRSGEVVDTACCLLATEKINLALQHLRNCAFSIFEHLSSVVIEEHGNETFLLLRLLEHSRHLNEALPLILDLPVLEIPNLLLLQQRRVLYARYRGNSLERAEDLPVPVGHFSQINQAANELLVETVLAEACASEITDLYAGAGNFSLPLARRGARVQAVELDPKLSALGAKIAADESLQDRLSFETSSCEKFLRRYSLEKLVVLDPPRQGAAEVVKHFDPAVTAKVVYVSCNLPTLCRDLGVLRERGYSLVKVGVLDMFPQTHHVETISVLRASGS